MGNLVVVLHVLSVFALVGAILGRNVTRRHSLAAKDLAALRPLVGLSRTFDMIVRSTSLIVLATGLVATWARGWPILGPLQGSPIHWPMTALLVYLTIVPWIVFVYLPRGKMFEARLAEAEAKGEITDAVRASLSDPVVRVGHVYEQFMIAVLVWLMVAKPF